MLKRIFSIDYWSAIILLVSVAIKRKNAYSILGGIWMLIQPFLHISVISFFMSFILKFEPKIIVTNLVGALPFWTFIQTSAASSSESLRMNGEVLKRVLLPKTYFPISDIISNIYSLFYSFIAMYIALIIFFPELFSWKIVFMPFLSIPLIGCVLIVGVVCSYATPYIRDIPRLLDVLLGVIYWTIPIIYPYSIIPESKRIFFELHPFYILLKPMQDLVITGNLPSLFLIIKSWIILSITLMISYPIYKKISRNVIYYL